MDLKDQPQSIKHPVTHAQGARVLFRRTNFFVLAPSYQNSRPVPPLAREGVEVDLDGHHAIPWEPGVTVLDAPTRSVGDRPAILLRASTWTVPVWLETIMVFVGLAASSAAHAINMFNYPHYEQDEGTYMMYTWAVTHGSITNYPYGYGTPHWPGYRLLPG